MRPCRPLPPHPIRAQRLSASEIGAVQCFFLAATFRRVLNAFRHRRSVRIRWDCLLCPVSLCSTPFGIGDRCGLLKRLYVHDIRRVLNAFRHRRSVRATRHSLPSITRRAQRLSASEIGAVVAAGSTNTPGYVSAQRLSASEIGADQVGRFGREPDRVLNAFRHRRSVRKPNRYI
ncbi:hypothetical protein dsmv_2507 [Desulfococcus multivorans DSM 2059]|uniref:Uncharacterized protein n=1 Tax=Desulfococcus multivorans DSM 2059 TaxID=1121405 RepID=S7V0B6_DESML|nr:hypothetical protein dsmv_2507 [Desulfococcus multivorans DSM 2059]